MLDRYSLSPMKEIWTEQAKYDRWLKIEAAAIQAHLRAANLEHLLLDFSPKLPRININAIKEIEAEVKHDVLAFVDFVCKHIPEYQQYFHRGLTSSDIVDSAESLAILQSEPHIISAVQDLRNYLQGLAIKHKYTPIMGRTHGVYAEPTTLGLKLLTFVDEMNRNIIRLITAFSDNCSGKLSGAVGNYTNISPAIEKEALAAVGLKPANVSSQILQRDGRASLIATMAIMAASIERMAVEIRHLHRTEVEEIKEGFSEKQKGSSAMPHKKNPIQCEQLCGLSRLMRSFISPAIENIPLWHERDISHSSVERHILPQAFNILFYMLKTCMAILQNLQIYPEVMKNNIDKNNTAIFQRLYLSITETTHDKNLAYRITQQYADMLRTTPATAVDILLPFIGKEEINRISNQEIINKEVIDLIFSRTIGASE